MLFGTVIVSICFRTIMKFEICARFIRDFIDLLCRTHGTYNLIDVEKFVFFVSFWRVLRIDG